MVKRILSIALLCGLVWCVCSCGDSAQKRARLSKAEKARLDSIDRASFKVCHAYARLSPCACCQGLSSI